MQLFLLFITKKKKTRERKEQKLHTNIKTSLTEKQLHKQPKAPVQKLST